jgi:hypothetical protein
MYDLQERSFKEFAARPENKPLLEQHQQQEVAAALELQEQQQLALLQQQVCFMCYVTSLLARGYANHAESACHHPCMGAVWSASNVSTLHAVVFMPHMHGVIYVTTVEQYVGWLQYAGTAARYVLR